MEAPAHVQSMNAQSIVYRLLCAAALAAVVGVVIVPSTHWLVVTQSKLLLTIPRSYSFVMHDVGMKYSIGAGNFAGDYRRLQTCAQAHSQDLELQMGASPDLTGLESLRARFPRSAALYASILRLSAHTEVPLRRKTLYARPDPKLSPDAEASFESVAAPEGF